MEELLLESPLFQGLSEEMVADLVPFCRKMTYQDGQVLVVEGTEDNFDLYLLVEGEVELILNSMDSLYHYREIAFSMTGKQVFGEISALLEQPRSATVRAVGKVVAVRIDGRRLYDHMERHRDVGYLILKNILMLMARRLHAANTLIKNEM